MPGTKAHSLNVWTTDDTSTFDLDVLADRVDITTTGGQPVKIHPVLFLGHSSGDIPDVAQKFHDTDAAIAAGNAGSAAASALVQQNLDSYEAANNAAVGALQASLATEVAQRQQGQTDDAAARAADKSELEAAIAAETTRASAVEAQLSSDITSETSRAVAAETNLSISITTLQNTLNNAIAVERSRIDDLVDGSSADLSQLTDIVNAYSSVDASTLNQISNLTVTVNNLVQRINELTSSEAAMFTVAIDTAVANVNLVNNKAFLQQSFSITFLMKDLYQASTGSFIGWPTYKAIIIASSSGILTNSSTDAEIEAFLQQSLDAAFGDKVLTNDLDSYRLKYDDYYHYLLETNLPAGSKPYFQGVSQGSLPDVEWRLSYCSVSGDANTIYSTILSGTQQNKVLTIVPNVTDAGVQFPVTGINGVRDGYKTNLVTLTTK